MSPDKKPAQNSTGGGDPTQECSESNTLDDSSGLPPPSASDVTKTSHGANINIPSITASQPTLKCSINDQMKTFDPGEESGIERLTNNHSGNSSCSGKNSSNSVMKNSTKNYKAGSKINKLADMLAKRSQNVVEVKQNDASDIITDITSVPKAEDDTVILNNVSKVEKFENSLNDPVSCSEKTGDENELKLYKKCRRKSVPDSSSNLQEMQLQSTSKSCSDFTEIFPSKENGALESNALGGDLSKLQTDESTKKKPNRKNLKNVELPLILPERKRRCSGRNENLSSSKIVEKSLDISSESPAAPAVEINKRKESPNEIVPSSIKSPKCSPSSKRTKKEKRVKQKVKSGCRKSKRLVENSTQTTDIEFLSIIKPNKEPVTEEPSYECLYCTEIFTYGSDCKAHEKTHSEKGVRDFIKCQYCAKKLSSLEELKSHCVRKHPNKYSYCMKCDERFATKQKLYSHNREIHLSKNIDPNSQNSKKAEIIKKALQRVKEREGNDKESEKIVSNQENSPNEDDDTQNSQKSVVKVCSRKLSSPKSNQDFDVNEESDSKEDLKVGCNKQNCPRSDQTVEDKQNSQELSLEVDEGSTPKQNSPKISQKINNKPNLPKTGEKLDSKENSAKVDLKIDKSKEKSPQVGQKIDNKKSSWKSNEKAETKQNNSNVDLNVDIRTENSPKVDERKANKQSDCQSDMEIDSSEQDNLNSDHAVENKQTRSRIGEKLTTIKPVSEKVDGKQNNSKVSVIIDNRKQDNLSADQAVENKPTSSETNAEIDTVKRISLKSDEKVYHKASSSKLEQKTDNKLNESKACQKTENKSSCSKPNQSADNKQLKVDLENRQNIEKIDCKVENQQSSSKVHQITDNKPSDSKMNQKLENKQTNLKLDQTVDNKPCNSKVDVKTQYGKQISQKNEIRNTPKQKSLKVVNQKVDRKQASSKADPKIEGRQNISKVDNKQTTSKGNEKIDSNKQCSSKSDQKIDNKQNNPKVDLKMGNKQANSKVDQKMDSKQNNPKVDFKMANKQSNSKVDQKTDCSKQSVSKVDQKVDNSKQSCPKADLKVDVSYENTKKSSVSPRNVQKFSPKESKTEEQLLEMEMLFYSHLSGNIQENLTNHLDGKIDQSGNPVRTDQVVETADVVQAKTKSSNLLSVVTPSAGVPDVQVSRAPSPYQTRSKTPNPLPPTAKKFKKLPNWQQKFWEKYNFPTNYRYEHRFWDKNYLNTDKSAFYLKDLSCLDIKTQLTMRENIKKLDSIKKIEECSKAVNKLKFPDYLALVPRADNGDAEESNSESQRNKKQVRKEEVKKSFKTPGSELPVVKSRRKLSSDNTTPLKRQSDRIVMEGLKMVTRRQSSLELLKDDKEESSRKRKGSLDMSEGQRMILRRQASLDNLGSGATVSGIEKNDNLLEINTSKTDAENTPLSPAGSAEISGEWVRPRSYLCGTCCTKFTNLWELEDHKWVSHPNVWCTHYEFEDEKIDKLFQKNEEESTEADSSESSPLSKSKLTDLYKRYLLPHGSLKTAKLVPKTNFPEQCTKCKKNCMNSSEMHKHMLDCGGDTTWFLTMYSSPMTIKRKWRPFGSRRRKQIGRRDVKRNIPSTPTLRSYHYQHRIRTKPGDVETIQKMLANLPEKRARRAINFDEIKTRSQATIHSNRLLRKRFKSSFSNNFLKFKTIKQKRPPLKQGRKESSSKSTTDTSSESTPIGSPKRRNKLKENLQLLKEENSRDGSSETSDSEVKSAKKKTQSKKKESSSGGQQEAVKVKSKTKKGKQEAVREKLPTKGNGSANKNKSKRKTPLVKEEPLDEIEGSGAPTDSKEKAGKNAKKRSNNKSVEAAIKEEVSETVGIPESKLKETPTKSGKKLKIQAEDPMEGTSKKKFQWASTPSNQILRLNQKSKEKTDLIKRIKKKFKNSKRILELKEAKLSDSGSRRSLRIKSLQQGEDGSEFLNGQVPDDSLKVETNIEEETRVKIPVVSLEDTPVKKPQKLPTVKNSKSAEQKTEKEHSDREGSAMISRRSSRSLRNSISSEEKTEVVSTLVNDSNTGSQNSRSLLRRNSKNSLEINEPSLPDVVIEDVIISKKSLRVQSERFLKSEGREKADPPKGQISLLKKNRLLPNSPVRGEIKLEETSDKDKSDLNKHNDLAEMPILAKVEPIRSKISRKNEKEIPILMPVEEEQNADSDEEMSPGKDSISFQVIKKRRKTSKEVTPLKIVKKVDSVHTEEANRCFQVDEEDYDVEESFKGGKNKKKKLLEAPSPEKMGKSIKTDVKKYFLGICPSEIDKGRKEGQEESGSDSEPLISLVINQNKNEEAMVKREEVADGEKKENGDSPPVLVKKLKKKKVIKKKKALPNIIFTCGEKEKGRESETREIQINPPEGEQPFIHQIKKKIKIGKSKKKVPKKTLKGLRMTVTLKEPTLKIVDRPVSFPTENKWTVKPAESKVEIEPKVEPQTIPEDFPPKSIIETVLPERRSRRISKETKSSSEFVIDDPLLLVDELWSDLDSDSDSSKKKSKKGKKKSPKKKTSEEKRISDVNLEELLRNFGENKESGSKKLPSSVRIVRKTGRNSRSAAEIRKVLENRNVHESYRRLSLKLFRFNKTKRNFGNRGERLSDAKKALKKKLDMMQEKSTSLPDLPFLAAEFKENPVQVIQCGGQKSKPAKRGHKRVDSKGQESNIHLKISLPLESIDNMAILNNNHLTELVVEETKPCPPVCWEEHAVEKEISRVEAPQEKETQPVQGVSIPAEPVETTELKNKTKRSEVIDKIFYCEICKTYYYSCSQLKIHKLSNRHKLKESELLQTQQAPVQEESPEVPKEVPVEEPVTVVENAGQGSSNFETVEAERLNEDTLEMPTLEGPFIENRLTRVEPPQPPPQPPVVSSFGFSQESLKDIQRAIGCTDEEMLILTLLGENTIEIENDILDLDSCKSNQSKGMSGQRDKGDGSMKDNEKSNGALKVDLKQRMTSALACLVNKAVFNLLQKYETAAKSAVNPEALSLLGKLSSLSRRKNILQLNELLKKQNDGESSISTAPKDFEKKEPTVSYKYQCTICGSRFEKASTRECHISRSHKGKAKKLVEDAQTLPSASEEDWNDSWNYDAVDDHPGSTTAFQFWCSDCGINFQSPQEVLEHQKLEHQAGLKEPEPARDSGPLQSSTIGSSDEIMEGKKTRRRPKLFSSEELDQQRIIANNELRKLDRKFSNKNKSGKIKWGMDALRFTVEKENKVVVVEEEKEIVPEEPVKPPVDVKNIDLVPKLNLSRTSNIPEFKVIQKNSLKSRFQKIIDNKLKRRTACPSQQEAETEEVETEVMLVPVVVKKKNKKQKMSKYTAKKEENDKPVDVYDFNESESEGEPVVYSHIKKPTPSPTKLRLVKVKEGPSKNKADSTTKDLAPDDYDSEDSLPLSVVKKSKPGEDEDEKEEKMSEDGLEKSEGILEQVEYLIEQLENETGSAKNESNSKENEVDNLEYSKEESKEDSVDSALTVEEAQDSLRVSVANEFLELDDLPLKNQKTEKNDEKFDEILQEERVEKTPQEMGGILAEPESSQSTFDEEDSIPLLLMSKKAEETRFAQEEKKCDENITDVSTTASEDVQLFRTEENKSNDAQNSIISQPAIEESLPPVFSSSENEGGFSEKSNKPFESLNGNVIYCRNDSMSDFGTDFSNDGIIDSNFEKTDLQEPDKSFIKEVTEKEDVVIVCSKGIGEPEESKADRKRLKSGQKKKKGNLDTIRKKKKRFPLLTATIEENNFRKSESPKLNKEVIVRKIWQRRKLTEDSSDNDEESYTSMDNENSVENIQNDESQTEIEKEIIVKRIWSRKKLDHEEEFGEKLEEKFEDIKINQTEISDEIVIKCGPKAKNSPKRRKSRSSTNESSKETIMRKIWSGRCTFQTKAALKTYDSDMIPNCKENEIAESQTKPKRRGRPSGFSPSKRSKNEGELNKDDEDDLDSLLEEIEREQLEKAIRSEFLQLRRSEKANVEMKDGSNPTVGLFAETSLEHKKEISERKRRKTKKKIKHPRQSLLKRKKYIKRPIRRVLPNEDRIFSESTNRTNSDPASEQPENSIEKNNVSFGGEGKMKIRKHKKHRHKHHHHKHKHKKSKHHKCIVSKHKSKHKFESGGEESLGHGEDSFTILEKICQDIPNQIENESHFQSGTRSKGLDSDLNSSDSKAEDTLSSFSYGNKTKEYPEFQVEVPGKERFESENGNGNGNIYEFVDDVPDFTEDGLKNLKM